MRITLTLGTALLMALPSLARAQDAGSRPAVPALWNAPYREMRYQEHYGTTITWPLGVIGAIPGYFYDRLDSKSVQGIADRCRAESADPWAELACASRNTDTAVEASGLENTHLHSFCRMHAATFAAVVSDLHLPEVHVFVRTVGDNRWAADHVVNLVTVRGADGNRYEYIFDTGWTPNDALPYNDAAQRLADPKHTGKVSNPTLPVLIGPCDARSAFGTFLDEVEAIAEGASGTSF